MVDDVEVPVSRERVENCLKSATFWVRELPRFADRQQRLADGWSFASGALAAATGLAIFPVLTDTSSDFAKLLVSLAAYLAAIFALIPRIRNYAEIAGQARELTSRYGGVVGDLVDLTKAQPFPADAARAIVTEFEAIKEKKDGLRGLPDRDAVELRRVAAQKRLLEAQAGLAGARSKASSGGE
jgi:hypothetical protein